MVVDDEPQLAEFVGELLESCNYQVTVVTDSKQALQVFSENPESYALLITDQTMPGMTGIELTQAMRALRTDLPVIMNTGFSDEINVENAKKMAIHFLEKPVSADRLMSTVAELLN